MTNSQKSKTRIGWREWVSFPYLGIPAIKAKIDTGARTSVLHAFSIKAIKHKGVAKVRFGLHPYQRRRDIELYCVAEIIDQRWVTDSGGHREKRYVIRTPIRMGDEEWSIEVTLTNRDTMLFRMLLGRSALKNRFTVDASTSFRMGRWNGSRIVLKKKPKKKKQKKE